MCENDWPGGNVRYSVPKLPLLAAQTRVFWFIIPYNTLILEQNLRLKITDYTTVKFQELVPY